MKKKITERSPLKRGVLNVVFVLLLLFPCAEIAARILGWKAQQNVDYKVVSTPKNWLVGDSTYGIKLNPGSYKVTLNDSLTFSTNHTEHGTRRLTSNDSSLNELWLLGCSFTYGYGVNDEQTFAQLIATHFNDQKVSNFSVPGFGEVQALLKLKEKISLGIIPKTVLVVYSKEHPQRNTMNRSYRSALHIGFNKSNRHVGTSMASARFPYFASVEMSSVSYVKWEEIYKNWIGRQTFAIVNALQTSLEANDQEENAGAVTEAVFREMADLCSKHKVNFAIVNLDDRNFNKKYPQVAQKSRCIPVNFDFSDQSITNFPYDNHPNVAGHKQIAGKVIPVLERILNEK